MKKERRLRQCMVTLALIFIGMGLAMAQTAYTGRVVSADDNEPVIGATILIKGTQTGTITNVNGFFTLNVPSTNRVLVVSYIGMKTTEVTASQNMVIRLETEASELDELLVVAYGTARKESFTGSAEIIKPEIIERRTVANVTKALDGLVAGVQSTSGSGQPGSGASIVIRGFGSINASQSPLYVLDGIPYDGQINAINPNDIESVTILKDASAGALFGSRGANGVVMITTKRGQSGVAKVNLRASWGVASRAIPRYETLNEAGYIETIFHTYRGNYFADGETQAESARLALNAMIYGDGINPRIFGDGQMYNPFNIPANQLIDLATGKVRADATLRYSQDWLDESTAHNPLRQEYMLTASGGNEQSRYMYSLGYLNEEGLLKTTRFERFTGRANVETQLHKHLKGGFNLSYTRGNSNTANTNSSATSNVFYSAQLMAPIYPVFLLDAAGNTLYNDQGQPLFDYGDSRPSGAQTSFNSIATLYDDKYGSTNDNVSGRTFLEFGEFQNALKGLKLNINLGIDHQLATSMLYYNPYFGNAASVKGSIQRSNGKMFSYTTNQLVTYAREIGYHRLDVLAGHEFYSYNYNYLSGSKTGFPFGGLYHLDAATTVTGARSYEDTYAIQSFLSRLNYDYQDKYYFSTSFRRDGSSRFLKENRWGNFWSMGASWRVSQEEFMKSFEWIDNLTAKVSYGVQGNDNVGSFYAWQSFFDLSWSNATLPGAMVSTLENRNLKWERNGNFNTGIEARMFNRVSATIEWYRRKTDDMLLHYPMATSTGFDGYFRNVGSMENTGLEITLLGNLIRSSNLEWNLTWMGSTVRNKVLSLYDRPEIITGNQIIREGEALHSFYTAIMAGVNPANGKVIFKIEETDDDGNKYWVETEDEQEAMASRQITGNRIPLLYGSFTNDFKYRNFDLSVMCTYSIGGKMLDGVYRSMMYAYYQGQAIHVDRAKAWKYPGDVTDIPRLEFNKTYVVTDKDLVSASYFGIKNITLGYTVPSALLRLAGMESVRMFATADNLAIFSHLKGMDPQYNFTGGTTFAYTPSRTLSVGVDIRF